MTSFTQVAALRLRRAQAHTLWAPSGVPVRVAPSWLLGIALTAWTVGDALLPDAVPGRSTAAYATAAIATAAAAALAFTLALHEAAHAVVARRAGLNVRRITLSFVGGALELEDMPLTPGIELRVALAGPVANGILAVAATIGHVVFVAVDVDPLFATAAAVIALGNLLIAVFNCIPRLPLDGGRALHAVLWALSGREAVGRTLASVAGRTLAGALLVLAVVASASADAALAIWLGLLGLSLEC